MGSVMNAATSPFFSSARSWSRSLNSTRVVSGSSGPTPSRNSSSPQTESAPRSAVEALAAIQQALARVATRANLRAESTVSPPELVK